MGALTTKLNVKNGDTVYLVTSYSTQDEGTVQTAFSGTTNLGTYWKITNNGVDAYIGLWPTSVTSGGNPHHSALQVIKGGKTYYVETSVNNNFTLKLAATSHQTITLKYTQPGASQVTKTSTSSAQSFTVKVGTTWTASLAADTGYTKGTLSPGTSGTVRAGTTVSATAATANTYTLKWDTSPALTVKKTNSSGSTISNGAKVAYGTTVYVTTTASWDVYKTVLYKGTSTSGTKWSTKTTRSFTFTMPASNVYMDSLSYDNNCDCDCDCSDCCVAEGTLITCYENNKYILKPVEIVQAGDIVVGANGELNEVYARTDTTLGKERTMFTFEDNSLYFTGEHSIWVRYKDEEYFGIHDISGYYREKTATVNGQPILEWEQEKTYRENGIVGKPISKGLSREPIFVLFDAEYGTDKGWKHNRAIIAKDKVYENDTPIHTLIVGGNHTFFANGYLVSGFATDVDYDYKNVKIEDLKLFEEN